MSLRTRLQAVVDGLPEGSTVSLPVSWLRGLLEAEAKRAGEELPELLTLPEVAQVVGRAESTVRTWCNSGRIPQAFRMNGRDWRVPSKALQEWIESQQEPEEAPGRLLGRGEEDLASMRRLRGSERKVG